MIPKRIGAVLAAVALIVGAWLVRSRVIDDDVTTNADGSDDRPPAAAEVLVCIEELEDACQAAVAGTDIRIQSEAASVTLDRLIASNDPAPLWLTFEPFPQMVNEARGRTGSGTQPIDYAATEIATSPIATVVRFGAADGLRAACGDPIDLGCLGSQPKAASAALSSPSSAIGILSLAAIINSYADDAFSPDTLDLTWARNLRKNSQVPLSAGTAVKTLQTRGTFDVAIGAEAELAEAQQNSFAVLYAEPMIRADVALMVPADVELPDGLVASVTSALTGAGWLPPTPTEPNALPEPGTILAIRAYWNDQR